METNNNVERKVLISFKVSTFFLIIIAILVIASVAVAIGNFITGQETKTTYGENSQEPVIIDTDIINSEVSAVTTNERTLVPSSRSLSTERTNVVVLDNEEVQEITEEPAIEETEEVIEEIVEEVVIPTTPIEEVTISVDMDLNIRTGLSKDDFIRLIDSVEEDTSGFFKENASLIFDLCENYSINEIFFCGLISAESGWNIAQNHRNTHNYISLMSSNGLIRYSSVEEGLEVAARTLHDKYLTPGGSLYHGSTLAGVKTRFCPASSTWVNLVYGRMQQIMK